MPGRSFQQTLFDLKKLYGNNIIQTLSERASALEAIMTGFPALDQVLGQGGIQRGHISAVIGAPTSGITTLALKLLASAQGSAHAGVYLDVSQTFDADNAALYGVAIERLLLVQPQNAAQALEIARDLAKTDRAALLVVDLWGGEALDPTAVRRLHDALITTHTAALFVLSTLPAAIDPYVQTCLAFERVDWLREYGDVVGYRVRATVVKNKPYTSGQTALLDIALDPLVEGDEDHDCLCTGAILRRKR